jgi:hypothetical protein
MSKDHLAVRVLGDPNRLMQRCIGARREVGGYENPPITGIPIAHVFAPPILIGGLFNPYSDATRPASGYCPDRTFRTYLWHETHFIVIST